MNNKTKKITSIVISAALALSMAVVIKGDGTKEYDFTTEVDVLSENVEAFDVNLEAIKEIVNYDDYKRDNTVESNSEVVQTDEVKVLAKTMLDSIPELKQGIEEELAEADEYINSVASGSDVLAERKEAYEKAVNENILKAVVALENISSGEGTYADIESVDCLFTVERDEQTLGSLPNQQVVADVDSIPAVEDFAAAGVLKAYTAPTSNDLAFNDEVRLTDAMKKKADELKTPKAVYEYVLNTYPYETYYGSRKGAVGTFSQVGGNDTDQASLLIAMLRYLGYSARYVFGTVTISDTQAMEITGTDTIESAARLIASQFIPTSTVRKNGNIVGLKIKHTWVEAYIPYSDYRADGNMAGDSAWIPLDPSFKEVQVVTNDFKLPSNSAVINQFNKKAGTNITKTTEGHVYAKEIVTKKFDYLPSSLPYTVNDMTYSSSVSENLKDKLALAVDGESLMSMSLAAIFGKSITISYEPEESYDADLIKSYGGIAKVPAYLVNVKPTVLLDGVAVDSGYGISLGNVQYLYTYIMNRQGTTVLTDFMRAGSVYEIVLDYQTISDEELSHQYNRLLAVCDNENLDPYSAAVLGPMLGYAGALYFSSCDLNDKQYSMTMGMNRTRLLAELMTGYKINVETIFGMNRKILPGNFQIDVGYNSITNISYKDDKHDEKAINILTSYCESAYEGQIWEAVSGGHITGISTIKVFNEADKRGIDTTVVVPGNASEKLPQLKLSQAAINEIKNALNNNYMVITVTEELKIDSWKGSGYILIDPKTGSSAYMISGGLAGGSSSEDKEEVSKTRQMLDALPDSAIDTLVETMFGAGMMVYYIEMEYALTGMIKTVAELETGTVIGLMKGCNDLVDGIGNLNDICDYYCTLLDTFTDWAVDNNADAGRDFVAAIIDEVNDMFKDGFESMKSIGEETTDDDTVKAFKKNLKHASKVWWDIINGGDGQVDD